MIADPTEARTMTTKHLSLFAIVAFAAGCSAEAATPSTPEPTVTDPVATAVAIAKAIRSTPAKSDSILTAWSYTADSFEKLLADIARDSTQSAKYAAGMR
jgi:hypothetical protein